jgi:MFS family permease
VLLAALMGCACSIGMLLIHTNPLALWVYIPLQQFSMALFWPTAGAVISNSVSEAQQGEALGILHSVDALAFAVSPLIAGPLLGIGNFMPIAVGMGTMVVATLLLSLSLRQKASLETLGS